MAIVGKALIDPNGNVVNTVSYDTASGWTPPAGLTMVDTGPGAEPGGAYSNGVFTHAKPKPVSLPLPTQSLSTAATGSPYQQGRNDVLTVLSVTTGTADFVVTLCPAALTCDGDEQTIRKADAGSTLSNPLISRSCNQLLNCA